MDSKKKKNEDSEDDEYLSDQSELSTKFEVLANSNDNETSSQGHLYTNSKYSGRFLKELRRLFIKNKFTDVELICESEKNSNESSERSIFCHKLVLLSFSPYFEAMFSSNLAESRTNKIRMPNTDYKTLNEIINYAYSGSIDLNVNNVQNIFSLASLLQIKDIVSACCDYMESQMDFQNSIDVYNFSKHHMCTYLINKSKEFINRNFTEIVKTNEFLELNDSSLLADLISNDDLDVPSEEFLLNTIVSWIEHDFSARKAHFEMLFFKCIRFSLLDKVYVKDFLEKNLNLLSSNPKCLELIESYLKMLNSDSELYNQKSILKKLNEKYEFSLNENKRAGMTKAQYCFILIGGNYELDDGFYVNCFNPFNGEKYFLSRSFLENSKVTSRGYFHIENPGVCVTESNRIFVTGGNLVYHEYKLFNKFKQRIKNRASSNRATSSTSSNAELQDSLLDDSLTDGKETLSKEVYEYDNSHEIWIRKANMLFAKANSALCAMGDKLYSFGGITANQDQFDIVESYDVNENKWSYVCSMPAPFVAGCVVRHEDCFYVLGGRSGVGRFDNCYLFKPDKREWHDLNSMKTGRFNFGACILNEKIYIFGGQRYNESEQNYYTREALDSVEIFDLVTREWSTGTKMPSPLYNCGVCIYGDDSKCVYVCGTTECKYSGNTLIGFIFTSVFRLEFINDLNNETKMKWTVVEHDVSDIKSSYRAIAARLNTRKLRKCHTDIQRK